MHGGAPSGDPPPMPSQTSLDPLGRGAAPARDGTAHLRRASLEATLDDTIPELLRMTGTPGLSIAVALEGEIALTSAYGRHDVAGGRALTPASIFPAGSMTKLYTAVAVLQLVESGVIGLFDAVDAHLDGVRCLNPLGAREITVYDLLTFRSGLATDTTASSLGPPPPLLEHVRRSYADPHGREYAGTVPRWGAPVGQRYHYANLGISTLGLLVEQRNPERLDLPAYLRRHVLEPLGMERSWLSRWDEPAPHPDRATGYACFGALALPSPMIRSADHPANGLHTTPADHLRLLLALLDGGTWNGATILRPETVRLMLTPQVAMHGGDGVWPGADWFTGLVAILGSPGERMGHFGHPGSHMWGWWCISRAYPEVDCAIVACANGWDMLRWHNPANRDAATMAVELVARWRADGEGMARAADGAPPAPAGRKPAGGAPPPRRSWSWKRSYVAGALLAERTAGSLGATGDLTRYARDASAAAGPDLDPDGLRAGVAAAGGGPIDAKRAAALLETGRDAPPPEQVEALLHDLGMAYGCPLPLWFWPDYQRAGPAALGPAASARSSVRAMTS